MKGVLKGFKYISTIFDEQEEEEEIQIGLPTDVKHVAHIGTDGPSTESPSWMKDFSSERPKSAPLDSTGETTDECQKTSTDTELPKASRRRHHSVDNVATFERSDRVGTTKSKGSRKHHKKMNSDGSVGKSSRSRRHRRKDSLSDQEGSSRSSRVKEDLNSKGDVPESTSLPDIPKKSRRKKVKDEINKIASKAIPKVGSDGVNDPPPLPAPFCSPPPKTKTKTTIENTSRPFSDPGSAGTDSTTTTTTTTITCDSESCHITKKPSPPSGGS